MTIQVINDAFTLQHSSSSDKWTIKEQEDETYLRFREESCDDDDDDDYTSTTISLSSKDSDDDSVSTSSSTVVSVNRVSFCEELITLEWTRPYTEAQDIPLLYYSTEETNRFRHEYRLERRMLSSLDIDDPMFSTEEDASDCSNSSLRLRKFLSPSTCELQQSKTTSCRTLTTPETNVMSRRAISRVVVLHNDQIASFSDSSIMNNCDVPNDFFDTTEFWSGSITWW